VIRVEPNLRLETLEIIGMVAAFVLLVLPRRRHHKAEDDVSASQFIELRVERGNGARAVRLPIPAIIGRAADATLVIADAQVSRRHARIDMVDGALFLHDLGSRNGTLLNARPIDAPVAIRAGDEINVGDARIVVGGSGAWK
jgi:pSer/pThr/pTyr-binding forkhead associated (FHA) protein